MIVLSFYRLFRHRWEFSQHFRLSRVIEGRPQRCSFLSGGKKCFFCTAKNIDDRTKYIFELTNKPEKIGSLLKNITFKSNHEIGQASHNIFEAIRRSRTGLNNKTAGWSKNLEVATESAPRIAVDEIFENSPVNLYGLESLLPHNFNTQPPLNLHLWYSHKGNRKFTRNYSTSSDNGLPSLVKQVEGYQIKDESSNLENRIGQDRSITDDKDFPKGQINIRSEPSHQEFRPISRINSQPDRLVSLFQSEIPPPDTKLASSLSTLDHFKHVDTLRFMIDKKKCPFETLDYLVEHFGSSTSQIISSSSFKRICAEILQDIIKYKLENIFDSTKPSITTIVKIFSEMKALNGRQWADLVLALLEKISIIKRRPIDDTSIIPDLVSAWKVVGNHSNFPETISPEHAKEIYDKFGLESLFGMIIPKIKNDYSKVPLVAIATFNVLTNTQNYPCTQTSCSDHLVKSLATVINVPNLDIRPLKSRNQHVVVKSHVFKYWDEIRFKAHHIMTLSSDSKENYTRPNVSCLGEDKVTNSSTASSTPIRPILQIHHKIRDAINLKNHVRIDELWSDVSTWRIPDPNMNSERSGRNGFLSSEICNHFILAYMNLQRPAKAIEVWQYMVSNGLNPSLKTWNIMISGCKSVNDWKSSEKIWNILLLSGLIPDALSWSARLSVLMHSKEIDLGIQALDEMGRLWLQKAQEKYPNLNSDDLLLVKDLNGAIKPDISCVNIVVDGLLKKRKRAQANNTIIWARKFGIYPNTETYNIFLRPLVRNGNNKEAMALLKRMEKAGVEADVATFTIILDSVLQFTEEYSPGELKEKIDEIFSEMEASNVQPNLFTYGKVIHQLVRNFNSRNSAIVEKVIERMINQGLKPSVQIYTDLVTFYFLQTPPNLDKAKSVIDEATRIIGLDRIFWDHVVECYAQIGETKSALDIIAKLSSEKTRVGWSALRSVLQVLYHQKEWNLAKGLVHDITVISTRNDFRTETKGEIMFWELAARLKNINV